MTGDSCNGVLVLFYVLERKGERGERKRFRGSKEREVEENSEGPEGERGINDREKEGGRGSSKGSYRKRVIKQDSCGEMSGC